MNTNTTDEKCENCSFCERSEGKKTYECTNPNTVSDRARYKPTEVWPKVRLDSHCILFQPKV